MPVLETITIITTIGDFLVTLNSLFGGGSTRKPVEEMFGQRCYWNARHIADWQAKAGINNIRLDNGENFYDWYHSGRYRGYSTPEEYVYHTWDSETTVFEAFTSAVRDQGNGHPTKFYARLFLKFGQNYVNRILDSIVSYANQHPDLHEDDVADINSWLEEIRNLIESDPETKTAQDSEGGLLDGIDIKSILKPVGMIGIGVYLWNQF